MKFTIIAVLFSLTFVATKASWDGAWDNGHDHGHWGHETHGISLNQGSGWDHHHHYEPVHHAHHDHHHASHYVAKTLGAVHSAPLPGHIHSVKSFNVAPAPGLGWDHHHHHHAPAHHDHHDHHHASHYVAKTLGAVHSAPLPGHIHSVKSFNVASAPGTH